MRPTQPWVLYKTIEPLRDLRTRPTRDFSNIRVAQESKFKSRGFSPQTWILGESSFWSRTPKIAQ